MNVDDNCKSETTKEIQNRLKDTDREVINDPSSDDEVHLGEMGVRKRARPEDIEDVFKQLPGTIFQLKTCLFRVSYIKDGKGFSTELLNG